MSGVNESSLVIQVRTTRVGDSINATGFTAIAVKEGNTEVIQVNLKKTGNITMLFIRLPTAEIYVVGISN